MPISAYDLRVLSEVGLVRCRADGRRRLHSLAQYEQALNGRLKRLDDYLDELPREGETQ